MAQGLSVCRLCPRACGADREAGNRGVCGEDVSVRVARAALHFWEEPPISLDCGSGTVFFVGCPLHCVYCQNAEISGGSAGTVVGIERLATICLELQEQGAVNINLVTPTHYTPQIVEALALAKRRGLALPIVWNTSGYETVATLESLAGIVDVYLTDYKYADSVAAAELSHAPDYPEVALAALKAMVEQVGSPVFDTFDGQERLVRGVIVRHLLLPGRLEQSKQAVALLHAQGVLDGGRRALLSLMSQYTPTIQPGSPVAERFPELLAPVPIEDYEALLDFTDSLGIEDYFWQDGPAAAESFIPPFDGTGVVE